MQETIQDKLEDIYENVIFEVEKKTLNKFYIIIEVNNKRTMISYLYDYDFILDYNIEMIIKRIDNEIGKLFRR